VKENCVGCYKERTEKYRIWFQAVRKENMNWDISYA